VGEHVFLRVTPFTSVGRTLKSKKLTPKFIGPYQILKRIGPLAYEIALPPPLAHIHNIFQNLSFEVKPIKILDSQVKQHRGRSILMVKVLWDLIYGDSTWEIEEEI